MFVPLASNWKDNFIIIVIWRKNLPWIVLWCPFPREVVWSICVYQSWDIFSVFLHITKYYYQYYYQYQYKYHLLHSPLFFSISLSTEMDSVEYELKLQTCFLLEYLTLGHIVSPDSNTYRATFFSWIRFICFFLYKYSPFLFYFNRTLSCTLKLIPNYK